MNKQQIRHFILLIFAIFLIIIDQLIKFIVMQNIAEGKNIDFIPKILSIAHVHNSAAAWNLLNGHIYLLTFITIIASGVIFYYFWQSTSKSKWIIAALLLMFSGAFGNLLDRIWHGYVIDMFKIKFINFPVFNIADSYLVIGVFLLSIYMFVIDREKKDKNQDGRDQSHYHR